MGVGDERRVGQRRRLKKLWVITLARKSHSLSSLRPSCPFYATRICRLFRRAFQSSSFAATSGARPFFVPLLFFLIHSFLPLPCRGVLSRQDARVPAGAPPVLGHSTGNKPPVIQSCVASSLPLFIIAAVTTGFEV